MLNVVYNKKLTALIPGFVPLIAAVVYSIAKSAGMNAAATANSPKPKPFNVGLPCYL